MEEMGLLDKLRAAFAPRPRLLEELEELAGHSEVLVKRLRSHARMCPYPVIAKEIAELAEREANHEKTLRAILSDHGRWPRPPKTEAHEGSNNWERLSRDLEILLEFTQAMNRHALKWEGSNPASAQRLLAVAREAADDEMELRTITAKCDPLALD